MYITGKKYITLNIYIYKVSWLNKRQSPWQTFPVHQELGELGAARARSLAWSRAAAQHPVPTGFSAEMLKGRKEKSDRTHTNRDPGRASWSYLAQRRSLPGQEALQVTALMNCEQTGAAGKGSCWRRPRCRWKTPPSSPAAGESKADCIHQSHYKQQEAASGQCWG